MRTVLYALSICALAGCSAAYRAPVAVALPVDVAMPGDAAAAYTATLRALTGAGYQIAAGDREAGIITTAPKQVKLDETYVDLGTTMGLPYVKDSRTITYAAINAQTAAGKVTLRAAITGKYLEHDAVHGKTMEGVSTGKLEREIGERIAGR